MLLILLSEFFSGRNFFSNRLFLCEIFSSRNFLLLFTVVFFNRNLFSTEVYFQPEFIFSRNLFSAEIYFQLKFIFNRNLFSTEIYFQQKFIFNRNLFSTEICFQPKFIFYRNLFSTEIFVISHELPLTTTDHVTEEIGIFKALGFLFGKKIVVTCKYNVMCIQ